MLPTLHHGVGGLNQSRLDYQPMLNDNRNSNINNLDTSDSRLNKSRLLDYGSNYNDHQQPQQSKANKYQSDYSHLPHIRQND
jgi:hypothetical protein